jgi:hypothetical protein
VSGQRSTLARVSESPTSASPQEAPIVAIEAEVLDALPVLAGAPHTLHTRASDAALPDTRRAGIVIPAVQAAAVAAGGFVAGAAVVGLVHRRQRRSPALAKGRGGARSVKKARPAGALDARRGGARAVELVQIVGSRSLLVDVHLLGGADDR